MRSLPALVALAAAACAVALVPMACATDGEKPASSATEAVPESSKPALDDLAARYWDLLMRHNPTWATEVGDHRFDDQVQDVSAGSLAAFAAACSELLVEADALAASPGAAHLAAQDVLTLGVLRRELSLHVEADRLGFHRFAVDQMYGPQASFAYFALHQHPMKTSKDAENLAARYRGMKTWAADHITNLRAGLAAGQTAPKVVVERVLGQLNDIVGKQPVADNPFGGVVSRVPDDLPPEEQARLREELLDAAARGVLAGFEAYRDFLRSEYLPAARDSVGLSAMPGGADRYGYLVRSHTTTSLTPDAIHQMGLAELERIEAEMKVLADERGHDGDVRSFLDTLMKDPANYAESRDALLESFKVALKRADAALPSAFGRLPKLAYRVEPMDAQREKDAPAAYYQPGSLQAGRDGVFVANLYRFEERPLMNSPVLAFHEAVPGHHLQIAIGQEVEGLPRFRAEGGVTAYVEGWALYSERLSDELGLYLTLEEKIGFLGFAAWRASRLVVDTGLHAKGWSRQHAIDFLARHTTLGRVDVENEIDRYIVMPGQALAYMVGCLRILALRDEVRTRQGSGFDLRAFHDALLGSGPLPLELMEQNVRRELGL